MRHRRETRLRSAADYFMTCYLVRKRFSTKHLNLCGSSNSAHVSGNIFDLDVLREVTCPDCLVKIKAGTQQIAEWMSR